MNQGDLIVHFASKNASWFKATKEQAADGSLNPDMNILAEALAPFTYQEGVGREYHKVKFNVKRRYFKPCIGPDGNPFSGGDIPILSPKATKENPVRNPEIPDFSVPPVGEVVATAST